MEKSGTQNKADAAREQGEALASTAGDEAKSVADVAQTQGRELAQDMRANLRHQADEQAERVVHSLRSAGADLSNMAAGTGSPSGPVVDMTRDLAGRVETMADRLEHGGIDGSLDDLRAYARHRPTRFVLGAFAVGFVAGRILRNAEIAVPGAGATPQHDTPSLPQRMQAAAQAPAVSRETSSESVLGSGAAQGVLP